MPKEKRVNERITTEQYHKLVKECQRKGMTISQWIANRIDLMSAKY